MFIIEVLKAILFGIIEGVTEWLPVSSTGHLIIVNELVRLNATEAFGEFFIVAIQLGAILAVPIIFGRKLFSFSGGTAERGARAAVWRRVFVGALPAAVLGVLLDDIIERLLFNYVVVAIALIVYGVAFIIISKKNSGRTPRISRIEDVSYTDALVIGLFQALSLVPGTSRSGSTILGGIFVGASRSASAEFSFLLAIPIMLGATLLKGVKLFAAGYILSSSEVLLLLVCSLTSFFISLISMRFLLDFVKRHTLRLFGYYRILLGALVLVFFAFAK